MTRRVAEMLEHVVLEPPASYCWLGQRHRTDNRSGALAEALRARLYSDFYITGGVAPPVDPEWPRGPWPSGDAVALREANAGRGSLQWGWAVHEAEEGALVVERDGLRVRASPRRVRSYGPPSAGDIVGLIRPSEALGRPNGFYTAFGDAGDGAAGGEGGLDRFYWNVLPSGRPRLVEAVTEVLNQASLPFRLKVLHDRATLRCDAAVLYMPSALRDRAAPLVGDVWRRVAARLRRATPVFTLRLAPGLAFAEDPHGDESFGTHRCRLLADGLVRAAEAGCCAPGERMDAIERAFAEEGLSIERAHLRPGSAPAGDLVLEAP